MLSQDPDINKGIWLAFTGAATAIGFWFRRRVKWTDDVTSRLATMERDNITRKEFSSAMGSLHRRLDRLFALHQTDAKNVILFEDDFNRE